MPSGALQIKEIYGAPGEIRTPDLTLRRTYITKNQQLTAIAMRSDELRCVLMWGASQLKPATLHRNTSGQAVGTKLGTGDWGDLLG
jgi:hypothetical protein